MSLFNEETDRSRCTDLAAAEIARGRSEEDIFLDLVADGWPPCDAEDICTAARKAAVSRTGTFGAAGLFKSISRLWNVKDGDKDE